MQTTIIDILKKGDQELFHSSIIAWLLNPNESHRLGETFLKLFLSTADQRKTLPLNIDTIDYKAVEVQTEVKHGKHRFDIVLKLPGANIVIENKVKSTGTIDQLKAYEKDGFVVIALGLFEELFQYGTKAKFPILTYTDVHEFIKKLHTQNIPIQFKTLIDEYEKYLARELGILSGIFSFYEGRSKAIPELAVDENSIRTYNYFLLNKLEQVRRKDDSPQSKPWHVHNKNARSGVWYAFGAEHFSWHSEIEQFRRNQGKTEKPLSLWFHIELRSHNGVLAKDDEEECGEIQLRSNACREGNYVMFTFMEKFFQNRNVNEVVHFSRSRNHKHDSFYVVSRKLKRGDLKLKRLEEIVDAFCALFRE